MILDAILLLFIAVAGFVLATQFGQLGPTRTKEGFVSFAYMALAILSLLVAIGAAIKFAFFDFRGIGYGAIEQLRIERMPALLLVYPLVFVPLGFVLAKLVTGGFFSRILAPGAASAGLGFFYQDILSPFGEEYFFRGALLPSFEKYFGGKLNVPVISQAGGFLIANSLQSFVFMLIHLVALGGNEAQLLSMFAFAFAMGIISRVAGILPTIGFHVGHNLSFPLG